MMVIKIPNFSPLEYVSLEGLIPNDNSTGDLKRSSISHS